MSEVTGIELIKELRIDPRILQDKKEQTDQKISFVRAYVQGWLRVWVNQNRTKSVTFIDAMSNAGVYRDGDFCTAAEVSRLYSEFAKDYPRITFNVFLNDLNERRAQACDAICSRLTANVQENVHIYYTSMDVNDFLIAASTSSNVPSGAGNAIILFVDPYNARTVNLSSMISFIESRYCEVLYNWFSSDLNRNKGDEAIIERLDGIDIEPGEDITRAIASRLKIKDMKFAFSYEFRNKMNSELYQIIFVTPNRKGLEVLKDAMWETFHGSLYHRNARVSPKIQGRLFGDELVEDSVAADRAAEARDALYDEFAGRVSVPFSEIDLFLLEQSFMKEVQIRRLVIKPMMNAGTIKKDGRVRGNNFSGDTFTFPPVTASTL